jgi:hypothetical protein
MMKLLQRCLVAAGLICIATTASAFPLRAPQVPFLFPPLQNYLNAVDANINVSTDQLNAPLWSVSVTGNTDFTLMLKTPPGAGNAIGIYNAGLPAPLFQVFPPVAMSGWFATLHFQAGNLIVTLFNQNSVIQGQFFYPGVNPNNFGFYTQGPGGLWFSEDLLNGGAPQMLAFASNLVPGDYWLCFSAFAYNPQSTFDDVVVNIQSVRPTPAGNTTWGQIKDQYR